MSTFISVRRFVRPDQPQLVPQAAIDAVVRSWAPIWNTELSQVCTGSRGALDVRLQDCAPEFTWVFDATDTVVERWGPAFTSELRAERTSPRPSLDVRGHEWSPSLAWIYNTLSPAVTTAQLWPAILESLGLSYRSGDRAALDVRRYDWAPDDGWVPTVVDRTVSTWAPIWNLGCRTPDRASLDLRLHEWSAPAWIFSALPVTTSVAQQWPAILQALGLSYRSRDRSTLDVRGHDWAPSFSLARVVDATVSTWSPIWSHQASSRRSPEGLRLDVRQYEWHPSLAWIFANLTAVTPAQLWPAILQSLGLSYRMADRPALDVRADLWSPESGWLQKVVDGVLSRYAPVFSAELQTYRSSERARLDVRRYEWSPEFFGVQRLVDAVVARYAPIWNAELGLWTPSRPRFDVRVEWMPDRGWIVMVLPTGITSPPDGVAPVGLSRVARLTRRSVGDLMTLVAVQTVTQRTVRPQVLASPSYDAQVLADSPIGYWPLDEASAPFLDRSGTRAATIQGTMTPGEPSLLLDPATSVLASGLDVSILGTSHGSLLLVAVGPPPFLFLPSAAALTVELWVQLETLTGALRIFFTDTSITTWLAVHNGQASWRLLNDDFVFVEATGGAMTVGPTYHVVGTYDGSNLILYLNGVEVARQPFTGLVTLYDQLSFGGIDNIPGSSLNGWIQKAAIYAQALTPAQVAAHYLARLAGPVAGLRLVTPLTTRIVGPQ